jgi:hypothetical protein
MFTKGKQYFIKTATDYYTGLCVESGEDALLTKAAWVASTGRFAQAMATGKFDEVEPYPEEWIVRVHAGSIISSSEWPHPLPREQK